MAVWPKDRHSASFWPSAPVEAPSVAKLNGPLPAMAVGAVQLSFVAGALTFTENEPTQPAPPLYEPTEMK